MAVSYDTYSNGYLFAYKTDLNFAFEIASILFKSVYKTEGGKAGNERIVKEKELIET